MKIYRIEFSELQDCFHVVEKNDIKCKENTNGYFTVKKNCSYSEASKTIKKIREFEKLNKTKITLELIKEIIKK